MPTLQNWSLTVHPGTSPFQAPELRSPSLQGLVFNHPAHPDGTFVITSPISKLIGGKAKTSSGTIYALGLVDPAYATKYPTYKTLLEI